jgi:hypothetical protein
MITITKAGNLVKIEHEGGTTYVAQNDRPYFRLTGTSLTFRVGEVRIDQNDLSNFTIEGVVPTDETELTTQLTSVFPNAGGAASTTQQTLSGLAPVWDLNDGEWAIIDAPTGNVSVTTSNVPTPGAGVLHFKQDATGGRTLQINSVAVEVDPAADTVTRIDFSFDGTNYVYVSSYSTGEASSGELTEYTGLNAPTAPATGVTLFAGRKTNAIPSFIDPDGILAELQAALYGANFWLCRSNMGSAATTTIGNTVTTTGSIATAPYSNTTYYNQQPKLTFSSTNTAGQSSLTRTTSVFAYRQWRCFASFTIGLHTIGSTTRFFAGFSPALVAIGNVEPSSLLNIIGVGKDSSDTNLQLMVNDGTGTATKTDLGVNFPANVSTTNWYELRLYWKANDTTVYYSLHRKNTGDIVTGSVTTDLPAASTALGAQIWINNGTTAEIVSFGLGTIFQLGE